MVIRSYFILSLTLILSVSCSDIGTSSTVTIFAAASLSDAFTEISTVYESQNANVEIILNFAGSSTLAAQLVEGAAADIFASANHDQMQNVIMSGRAGTADVRVFAGNRLTVIMPSDNPADIRSLKDLADPDVELVLAAPGVPVRSYTDLMLEQMAASPDYGVAYRDAVMDNLVSEEDNVRLVVLKVNLGEADAGIVYESDVTAEVDTITLNIPAPFNVDATYPIVALNDTSNTTDFIQFVLCGQGQAILEKWGFTRAEEPAC